MPEEYAVRFRETDDALNSLEIVECGGAKIGAAGSGEIKYIYKVEVRELKKETPFHGRPRWRSHHFPQAGGSVMYAHV